MQRRPGLIVLAILNFLATPVAVLMALVVYSLETKGIFGDSNRPFGDANTASKLLFAGFLVVALLLVVSGIGYLMLRRFGRYAGTAFALVALAIAIPSFGEGSGLVTLAVMACAAYPIVTLVLINSRYRADLVR
jgi:hypothetical protein